MEPRHLVQLATILEKGSITAAGKHLGVAQPTLTRNMKTLERQAGAPLFGRSRYGVRGTPLGEQLAREGRAIARGLDTVRELTSRHKLGLRNQVRLGAGPLIGAALLPALTPRLLAAQPGIALSLRVERPTRLVDQLQEDEHDLIVAPSWAQRPPEGIDRVLLAEDAIGVFCGHGHPLAASGRRPSARDFHAHDWISLGTASPFEDDVFRMLSEAGIHRLRTQVATTGDAYVLLRLVQQGRHLAVLPRRLLRLLAPDFPLVELPVRAAPPRRDLYLWWRSASDDDAAFGTLRETVQREARAVLATADPVPAAAGG